MLILIKLNICIYEIGNDHNNEDTFDAVGLEHEPLKRFHNYQLINTKRDNKGGKQSYMINYCDD